MRASGRAKRPGSSLLLGELDVQLGRYSIDKNWARQWRNVNPGGIIVTCSGAMPEVCQLSDYVVSPDAESLSGAIQQARKTNPHSRVVLVAVALKLARAGIEKAVRAGTNPLLVMISTIGLSEATQLSFDFETTEPSKASSTTEAGQLGLKF